MKLIIATKNQGKLKEIKQQLEPLGITILSLHDYPEIPAIVEDGDTFVENAGKKAHAISQITHEWVLADDSGLEVKALHGEPGVQSARYAGENSSDQKNNKKLLSEIQSIPLDQRQARFVCVMILMAPDQQEWILEGQCQGSIITSPRGNNGFGYDPIFWISEKNKTMAEIDLDEKNLISHRGKALKQLVTLRQNLSPLSKG